jgi:hypothetical protein
MSPAQPTPHEVYVALQALRDDADDWADAAEGMRAAARRARDAALPPATFSFAGQGVAAAYEALRVRTADLLAAGSRNFDDIAVALLASAASYEADEAAHVQRLTSAYRNSSKRTG